MIKISKSSRNITAFGGINFIYEALTALNINDLFSKHLGNRARNSFYNYADISRALFFNMISGGEFVSDIESLKVQLSGQKVGKIPSHDTIGKVLKELKRPTEYVVSQNNKDITHQINFNTNFNNLLVELALKTGEIKSNHSGYVLDVDNYIIPNDKFDAKYTYKSEKGYQPFAAFIGKICVFLENHNGNTPARSFQEEMITRCMNSLRQNDVKISHFRADSASYQSSIMNLFASESIYFYIRPKNCEALEQQASYVTDWKSIRTNNNQFLEVGSFDYAPTGCNSTHKMVVYRTQTDKKQLSVITGDAKIYQFIITNNREMTEQQVIEFYNQRGDAENSNKQILEDANCKRLPCSDLDANTSYLYMMAAANTLFEWSKSVMVKNNASKIKKNMRVKNIVRHYVQVATEWIYEKGEEILVVYSNLTYNNLIV